MGDTKNDLNRIGLFSELGYVSVGDPYVAPNAKPFNVAASKGKQMLPGGSKMRSALQVGYFDKTFNRIMQGEGYSDPVKLKRQHRLEQAKKNLGKAFVPSHAGKAPSGKGGHYGTFSGPVSTLSAQTKDKKPYISPGRNFITNPSKKGTGYGYTNVFIGKPQQLASEPYNRAREIRVNEHAQSKTMMKGGSFKLNLHPNAFFDSSPYKTDKPMSLYKVQPKKTNNVKPFMPSSPGKELKGVNRKNRDEIGGSKAGCFTQYPSHSNDPYVVKKSNASGEKKIFRPSQGPKTLTSGSIVAQNVNRTINRLNFTNAGGMATVSVS